MPDDTPDKPQIEGGSIIFLAGEAIPCGDEMMVSPDDGKVYRATQDATWRLGPARRDYAAGEYIVRDGRRSW